jgi:hypothetical protein
VTLPVKNAPFVRLCIPEGVEITRGAERVHITKNWQVAVIAWACLDIAGDANSWSRTNTATGALAPVLERYGLADVAASLERVRAAQKGRRDQRPAAGKLREDVGPVVRDGRLVFKVPPHVDVAHFASELAAGRDMTECERMLRSLYGKPWLPAVLDAAQDAQERADETLQVAIDRLVLLGWRERLKTPDHDAIDSLLTSLETDLFLLRPFNGRTTSSAGARAAVQLIVALADRALASTSRRICSRARVLLEQAVGQAAFHADAYAQAASSVRELEDAESRGDAPTAGASVANAIAVRTHSFESRLQQIAPGSTRHTIGDVIAEGGIYVPVPWRRLGTDEPIDDADLAEELAENVTAKGSRPRHLIVASPGSGKSTLTLRVADRLRAHDVAPVLVDLVAHKEERGLPEFASSGWLRARYGVDDASRQIVIILDALDELLSGLPAKEIDRLLERELFTRADVVTCRRSYFERYLVGSPFADRFTVQVELLGLTAELEDRLAHRYLTASFPEDGDELTAQVVAWLNGDRTRRTLCSTPLHLLLAVESITPTQNRLSTISDLVGLWQAHIDQVLTREAHRVGTVLDKEEKLAVLGRVAWHFYDEEGAGSADPPLFTREELGELLRGSEDEGSLESLMDDIENHTLLTFTRHSMLAEPQGTLHFTHRSLHMYFVARHLYQSMTSRSAPAMEAFSKFVSGEVSRMLLEFITRLHSQPRVASRAREVLRTVLDEPASGSPSALTRARVRIARQQAAYYLGAVGGPASRAILTETVASEQDAWVARGMAIALSLAGDSRVLDEQIEARRRERSSDGPSPLCDVNLGYHLSFAGDQPLDILAPDLDQGDPTCALTVSTLIRQLEMPEKRGSWRSTLFTLADLAHNRPVSRASFEEAVRRDRARFDAALQQLADDPGCREWPELAEARAAVDDVD